MIYFVVLLLGLIYTENLTAGIGFIETNASLIILPLAFPVVGSLDKSRWRNLINAFILGLVVACLACLSYSAYNYGDTGDKDYFFYYNFTKLLGAHPTYYAYYIIFSITWIYYTIFFNTQSSYPVLRYVGVVFLFFVLLLTGGQTSFISLLFCFSFFILKFILESKNSQKNIVIIGIILMLAVMFIYSLNMSDSDMNDSWDRFNLWEAAIHSNTNPVLGEGTGDNRDVLNDYYKSHHMAEFANSNMNSHNQFIQTYVSNGILGLVSILILLMSPIYRSFKMASSLGILIFFSLFAVWHN